MPRVSFKMTISDRSNSNVQYQPTKSMSTAYVVANGNITNRNIQQNANSAGSGSILLANAPGDRLVQTLEN